jgi:deazaflavin-dependent oxidoreductase (nitroreductase family)
LTVSEDFIVRLTTNPALTWWVRNVASKVDPWLFKSTGGRFFSMGKPAMPMVTLTTTGARSGKPRDVHFACLEHEGDLLVVASAMGQARHPAWAHNLDAHPAVDVQATGERYAARARLLSGEEKALVWPRIRQTIPQMRVYEKRTDRNIRVYRLARVDRNEGKGS